MEPDQSIEVSARLIFWSCVVSCAAGTLAFYAAWASYGIPMAFICCAIATFVTAAIPVLIAVKHPALIVVLACLIGIAATFSN